MKSRIHSHQAGFTLVEIAVVLVIIGVLLVGVLQGQEMIQNSRIKSAKASFDAVSSAFNSYIDRFNRIPGDDGPTATITARGTNWTNVVGGNNNGVLAAVVAQTFAPVAGSETAALWGQLRASGFIAGDLSTAALAMAPPSNPWGGLIGITSDAAVAILLYPGNKVCMSQVPGTAARGLDAQFDDGLPNSGMVRATQGVAGANTVPGAAATAYVDENSYTVCRRL